MIVGRVIVKAKGATIKVVGSKGHFSSVGNNKKAGTRRLVVVPHATTYHQLATPPLKTCFSNPSEVVIHEPSLAVRDNKKVTGY